MINRRKQDMKPGSYNNKNTKSMEDWINPIKHIVIPLLFETDFERSLLIKEINRLSNLFLLWSATKGTPWTIKRIKLIRLIVFRFLSGKPIKVSTELISLTTNGLPKCLGKHLNKFIEVRDPAIIKFVLTALQLSKYFNYWGDPDIQSITDPFKRIDDNISPTQASRLGGMLLPDSLKRIGKILNIKKISTEWKEMHLTTKSGPTGGPALSSSIEECKALSDKMILDLKLIGGDKLHQQILRTKTIIPPRFQVPKQPKLRKLGKVLDPESKVRIIGLLDYWTQTCLRPLHDEINKSLRGIIQDCTFNQDKFITRIRKKGPFYSFDLSKCTDRLPIEIQKEVISLFIGKEKAEAWRSLLTDYEFYVPWESKSVKYTVGQPMGAYSSWPAMAITHHFIVQYSAKLAGYTRKFTKYFLLGDDIVIMDSEVAKSYREIMNYWGVEINLEKTLVSEDTFEFAKRIFIQGNEVSHFPLQAIVKGTDKHYVLSSVLLPMINRRYINIDWSSGPGDLINVRNYLMKIMNPDKGNRIFNKVISNLIISDLSRRLENFDIDKQEIIILIKLIYKYLNIPNSCNQNNLIYEKFIHYFILAKSQIIEARLHEISRIHEGYKRTLSSRQDMLRQVSPSQLTFSISDYPEYQVGLNNCLQLQGIWDDLQDLKESKDLKMILHHSKSLNLVDPTGLTTNRKHIIQSGIISKNLKFLKDLERLTDEMIKHSQ